MLPADINLLTTVGDPQLSPDGRHIAYVLTRIDESKDAYTSQIWLATSDGSRPPRALTSGEHRDRSPRWSPDGSSIAFASSREADGDHPATSSLHLLPFDVPGETVLLAEGDEGFSDLAFSPDGRLLAVTHRVRTSQYDEADSAKQPARRIQNLRSRLNGEGFVFDRPQHVHVVPTDGSGALRDLTPGPWEYAEPAWLDDDRLVAVVDRMRNDFTTDIGIIALDGADLELLTDATGSYDSPTPMPDGTIAVLGRDDHGIYPVNAHVGTLQLGAVAAPDYITTAIDRQWTPVFGQAPTVAGPSTLVASFEDRGNVHLARIDLAAATVQTEITGARSVTGWSTRDIAGEQMTAFTATSATAPSELFVLQNGDEQQLTDHGRNFVATTKPQPLEHFTVGDHEIDAWLMRPPGFDPDTKYPMLLNIHGGPYTQYGNFLFDEFQLQAKAGYVVLCANPRGSSGRDQAWGQAIVGPHHPVLPGSGWGGVDFEDLMAVVDDALDRFNFIDSDRLGVLGGSYGGYMTSWIVTHDHRFAAACSERAANDLLALEYGADLAGIFYQQIGPTFIADPSEYLRQSPVSYVSEIDTPLLIIHSEDDLRCPDDQAWQLFNACQILGKEVEFWLFPGENHELSRAGLPSHRVQRAEIILEFFGRHLSPSA